MGESGQSTGAAVGTAFGAYFGGPYGAAAGASTGGQIGGMFDSTTQAGRDRNLRTAYKYQARYQPEVNKQVFRQQIKSYKEAGLHPLAALGISTGSGGGQPAQADPQMPGQSSTGSAIGEGLALVGQQSRQTHGAQMGKMAQRAALLGLEEQGLRNDYLRAQIAASEQRRLMQLANSQRPVATILDPAMRRQYPHKPGPNEMMRRTFTSPDGTLYTAQGGTSAEALEADIGEWADWMPHTLGRAYDVFKAQSQNLGGVDPNNTVYQRMIRYSKRPHAPRRNVRGKSKYGPRS